jgi:hypothetical protein
MYDRLLSAFDKSLPRAPEEMCLQEQPHVNDLSMEQNDLPDRQNSIADKFCRTPALRRQ